jgi:hypothetical protein
MLKSNPTCWKTLSKSWLLLLTVLIAPNIYGAEPLYPPYPEAWDWVAPAGSQLNQYGIYKLKDGDIAIAHYPKSDSGATRFTTFFGKRSFASVEKELGGFRHDDAVSYFTKSDGEVIQATGGLGTRSGGCYDRLRGHITTVEKSAWKLLTSRTLLYVFDRPQHYRTDPNCLDGPSFNYRVDAVFAQFVPLEDRTFLLIDGEHGLIVRFDEAFRTKSKLLNKRLFWMDTNQLQQFEANYGDRAVGNVNLGQLQKDLYRLLIKAKGNKQ